MKKTLIATTIIAATFAPTASYALELETKQAGVATTAIIGGSLLGGPVGMLAGFISGIYITHQMEKNEAAKALENDWQETQTSLAQVTQQLHSAHTTINNFDSLTLDQLNLQVMFHTGDDKLTAPNKKSIDTLAKFLVENPSLQITLDGFSDPRGTDGYNTVLSDFRTLSVANALTAAGVSEGRIKRNARGVSSSNIDKDYDSYALQRRVDINIYSPENQGLASTQ